MNGLFADIELAREKPVGRRTTKQNGHYAAPGTGPAGETCATCRHATRIQIAPAAAWEEFQQRNRRNKFQPRISLIGADRAKYHPRKSVSSAVQSLREK